MNQNKLAEKIEYMIIQFFQINLYQLKMRLFMESLHSFTIFLNLMLPLMRMEKMIWKIMKW